MRDNRQKYQQNAGHIARSRKRNQNLAVTTKSVKGNFNCFIATVAVLVVWVAFLTFFSNFCRYPCIGFVVFYTYKLQNVELRRCSLGFSLENDTCTDVNECEQQICSKNSLCHNTQGSYECHCLDGFLFDPDSKTCRDIDECSQKNACRENAECINTHGNFTCQCKKGYSGHEVCNDINECSGGSHNCDRNAVCVNSIGSYTCQCQEKLANIDIFSHPLYLIF